jgi:hypothetical protein
MNRSLFLIVFSLFLTTVALGANTQTVRWGHQLMSETDDVPRSAAVDNEGGIYFAFIKQVKDAPGWDGKVISKSWFLLKYNQEGEQLWNKQLDPGVAEVSGLTADDQGNIYVFGPADSTSERKTKGKVDGYIAKYDQTGTQLWARLIGTPEFDICTGLDVDVNGNLYISGFTDGDFAKPNKGGQDMFIAAYNQDGSQRWRDQIGTAADDRGGSIRLGDDNDVYVCGDTSGSLARENNGQGDFFVARYERTGKRLWLHQFGTNAFDTVRSMEIGELGHLYLGCRTNGNLRSRSPRRRDLDSCLVSISKEGKMLWARQFGPAGWDGTWDMDRFTDGSGDVLIAGCQIPLRGKCQAYSRRYSSEGKLIWTQEFRKSSSQGGSCGRVVAVDKDNNVYLSGWTKADLFGVSNGTGGMFIVKFDGAKGQ